MKSRRVRARNAGSKGTTEGTAGDAGPGDAMGEEPSASEVKSMGLGRWRPEEAILMEVAMGKKEEKDQEGRRMGDYIDEGRGPCTDANGGGAVGWESE